MKNKELKMLTKKLEKLKQLEDLSEEVRSDVKRHKKNIDNLEQVREREVRKCEETILKFKNLNIEASEIIEFFSKDDEYRTFLDYNRK